MNEFRAFLFLVISCTIVAGTAVWAQVHRVRMGYEIHQMQQEYQQLQDDLLHVKLNLQQARSPQALQKQMQRFKLDLQQPTGTQFVDPRVQHDALSSVER